MSERPTGRSNRSAGETTAPEESYECTYCGTAFGEFPDGCPECGQLVVRIVEPGPVPDR